MKDFFTWDKSVMFYSSIMGVIYTLLGGDERIIKFLLFIMIVDFITGTLQAFYNKKVDSGKIYKGIIKKLVMLLVIIVANQVELTFSEALGMDLPFRDSSVYYYIYLEFVSFTENIGKIVELPKVFTQFLTQIKDKGDM